MLTNKISDQLEMIGYLDANFANDLDNRKSTLGFVFMLVSGTISWKSAKIAYCINNNGS